MTIIGTGTANIIATQAASGGYNTITSSTPLTVNGTTPTLTGLALSAPSVNYGATAPTVTPPTSPSDGAITYTSSDPLVATVDPITGVVTIIGTGTANIIASQVASGGYSAITLSTPLTVNSTTPTLTGFALSSPSVSLGGTAPTVTLPTSTSTGAITYTSSNPAVATVDPTTGVVTIVGVGTANIIASQAARGGYNAIASSTPLVVNPNEPSISVTKATAAVAVAASATSDFAYNSRGSIPSIEYQKLKVDELQVSNPIPSDEQNLHDDERK